MGQDGGGRGNWIIIRNCDKGGWWRAIGCAGCGGWTPCHLLGAFPSAGAGSLTPPFLQLGSWMHLKLWAAQRGVGRSFCSSISCQAIALRSWGPQELQKWLRILGHSSADGAAFPPEAPPAPACEIQALTSLYTWGPARAGVRADHQALVNGSPFAESRVGA